MEHYWAGELVLVPEVLQRSVAKVFLTTEVPHAGFDAPLDPLCRWPFLHVLGRRAGVFLDAFPESFPHLTIYADKGTSDVLAGARLCHQSERGLPLSRSTPRSSNSLSVKVFVFSQLVVGPLRYLLSRRQAGQCQHPLAYAWNRV